MHKEFQKRKQVLTSAHLGTDMSKGESIPQQDLIDLTNEADDEEDDPKTQASSAHKTPAKLCPTLNKELSLGPNGSHLDLKSYDSPSTCKPHTHSRYLMRMLSILNLLYLQPSPH
ncbi:uncharacterized protein VP01_2868g1 [Puccinia sorghi]|uniref:Uncharacterized protein n=1 Tax=Puccinia sorghi TaxID=27349 RepID=A0A0L6V3M8_9BASI|nr:uncharacterized protein VP01_2868g1 [Puccinia sorghi]